MKMYKLKKETIQFKKQHKNFVEYFRKSLIRYTLITNSKFKKQLQKNGS